MPGLCVWSHVASTVLLSCLCRRERCGLDLLVPSDWWVKFTNKNGEFNKNFEGLFKEWTWGIQQFFDVFQWVKVFFLVSWCVATLFAMNRYQLSRRMCHGHLKMCRSWRQVRTAPRKCLAEKPENGVACVAPKSTGFMRFYGRWSEYIRISLC